MSGYPSVKSFAILSFVRWQPDNENIKPLSLHWSTIHQNCSPQSDFYSLVCKNKISVNVPRTVHQKRIFGCFCFRIRNPYTGMPIYNCFTTQGVRSQATIETTQTVVWLRCASPGEVSSGKSGSVAADDSEECCWSAREWPWSPVRRRVGLGGGAHTCCCSSDVINASLAPIDSPVV